jgi:nicotinate phosphoribosyltransferase
LLETTLLNLVNFSSLIATNAARHRQAVGRKVVLLEFGLRRAQGPDGGMSASRFSYIGGYNGTSNVLAGMKFGIPVKGTHAHSYVSSFKSFSELDRSKLKYAEEKKQESKSLDIKERVRHWQKKLKAEDTNEGELTAFTAYALDYPRGFIALIDTYNSLKSGMVNFVIVAMALIEAGYKPIGVRIDSGDIVLQSKEIRKYFISIGKEYGQPHITNAAIFASDGIDEDDLHEYSAKGNVSAYGVGTNLVTCKKQPALGGVYKLVELNNQPRIKLSEDPGKITLPGKKNAFRVYGKDGNAVCDVMAREDEGVLTSGSEQQFRYFTEGDSGRVRKEFVFKCEPLLTSRWEGGITCKIPAIQELRDYCIDCVYKLPEIHRRRRKPVPYPLLLTEKLYQDLTSMIKAEGQ